MTCPPPNSCLSVDLVEAYNILLRTLELSGDQLKNEINLLINVKSVSSISYHKVNKIFCKHKLSRGEICVANLKVPLQMVRVWTGF